MHLAGNVQSNCHQIIRLVWLIRFQFHVCCTNVLANHLLLWLVLLANGRKVIALPHLEHVLPSVRQYHEPLLCLCLQ